MPASASSATAGTIESQGDGARAPVADSGGSGAGGVSAGGPASAGTRLGSGGAPLLPSAAGATASGQPSDATPNEWPMMGYDAKNWYFNPHETHLSVGNASQLTERWRFTVSGMPIGTPIIAEGKVFSIAGGGTYALDFETGKQLWYRDDITGTASLAYADGFVYVQNSLPPQLYKLNAADGKTVWGPIGNCDDDSSCAGESSPIVVGDSVYVGMERNLSEGSFNADDCMGKRGGVRAFGAASGELRWLYHTIPDTDASGENGASVWSTVSIDPEGGMVFATTGNNYTVAGPNSDAFHAIDLTTGEKRWVHQVRSDDAYSAANLSADLSVQDLDFGANPILAEVNGRRVVAAGDKGGMFWVLDRDTGEVVWSRGDLSPSHDAQHGGVFISGAFDGEAFYVAANDPQSGGAVLHRLAATDGQSTWSRQFKEVTWGALSLANGLLFVPNNASLYVLSAATGDVLTQFDTGGTIGGGAAAVVQGRVVVKSGMLWTDPTTEFNDQIICYGLPSDNQGSAKATGAADSGAAGSAAASSGTSFSALYRNIVVDGGCNGGQCHSRAAAGALDMSSQAVAYTNLVGVSAMGMAAPGPAGGCAGSGLVRVVPGDPDHSLIVAKLEHTQPCGEPMPNAGTQLPATQLQQLRAWIAAGAPND